MFGKRDSETRGLGRGDACTGGRCTQGRVFVTNDLGTRCLGRGDACMVEGGMWGCAIWNPESPGFFVSGWSPGETQGQWKEHAP